MNKLKNLVKIEHYQEFVGQETVDRVKEKAKPCQGSHVAHINSTFYGGGVAEMLSPLPCL